MLVTLVTSDKKNFPGFRANFSQTPLPELGKTPPHVPPGSDRYRLLCDASCAAGCGATLTADRGFISSPYFPVSYPPSTSCTWSIEVRE